ncbi:DUF3050 domain-containing protein [Galbibacter pacificus]|uniref:DUF3050 domain-containing protein n=1 Tax=Galbibacter pacificus TaxID=2996052 RepID=A0ABT6FWY3_9FLAO|nr:DUF3050 domain-containing protein [Galbibacter pacificus]MDG3583962.1 DUF3050 domain-containing protein [Galbibacter pacificus]MDG3587601.1 DUF3050 domain-containing protein [Galbibacter pacificus]
MIQSVKNTINAERRALLTHELYGKIQTPQELQLFLKHHVFAVWDFMSLLKALQNSLTCTTLPWKPVGAPQTRYLINEIVLGEETDVDKQGNYKSHYEMYLEAMEACDAPTDEIESFVNSIAGMETILQTIDKADLNASIKEFLTFTFKLIAEGKPHKIAAAFTFGREDLIPEMFTAILKSMQKDFPELMLEKLIYYFDRHIEVDGDTHGPLAHKMIEELCGNDSEKWNEVTQVAKTALLKRIVLWEGIEKEISLLQKVAPIK